MVSRSSQDGKVRSDMFYPAGFMDVVQIEKTKDLPGEKGRFGRVTNNNHTMTFRVFCVFTRWLPPENHIMVYHII